MNIPSFENAHVLVAGDVMLDRYLSGDTSRVSPEAPVPIVHVREEDERPGGAGNVALNLAALGANASLVALTGDDEDGERLLALLAANRVHALFHQEEGALTIVKLRVLSRHQQLIRLDFENGFHEYDKQPLLELFRSELALAQVVVLSDYAKGTLRPVQDFIAAARDAGKPVLVDPKSDDFAMYRGASVITPNLGEFEAVAGPCRTDDELAEKAYRLIQELELDALLVTRSDEGMSLVARDQAPMHLPAEAREVYDVTGAGDTVIAMLAAALSVGCSYREAAVLANTAAGIAVSKLGAATVSAKEIEDFLDRRTTPHKAIVDEDELLALVQSARDRGEKIVMTNGCFDILHPGHTKYLEEARSLGDRLIVAVNDDDSVRRLKGPPRPICPLEHRMALLAALESTDWVVPFSEDTPERIISRVKPDILVKGGDYRPDKVVGARYAGQVIILKLVEGCSTTGLIETIRERC